jgi:hypothetical protein
VSRPAWKRYSNFLASRRLDSSYEVARYKRQGLDENSPYMITNIDHSEKIRMNGRELMDKGLRVENENRPGAVVIIYKKI